MKDDDQEKEEDSKNESNEEQVKGLENDMNDVLNDELEDELVDVLEGEGKLDGNWVNETGMNWALAGVCKLDGVLIEVRVWDMGRVLGAFLEEASWDHWGSN